MSKLDRDIEEAGLAATATIVRGRPETADDRHRRIVDQYQQWRTNPPETLLRAIRVLQSTLPQIKRTRVAEVKTATGPYRYNYAGIVEVSEAMLPLLGNLGLVYICAPNLLENGRFVLECELVHEPSGQSRRALWPLPQEAKSPQGVGSAMSYGRRYVLCALTGLVTEEDDDAALAEAEARPSRPSAQRQRATAPSGRTAQRSRASAPDDAMPPVPGDEKTAAPRMATGPMLQKIVVTFDAIDLSREDRLLVCSRLVGRRLASAKDLTFDEARAVIDQLTEAANDTDGPSADGFRDRLVGWSSEEREARAQEDGQ